MKRNRPYRQGIITTNEHPKLLKGQVIEILSEDGDYYNVRVYINANLERIEKKYILVN